MAQGISHVLRVGLALGLALACGPVASARPLSPRPRDVALQWVRAVIDGSRPADAALRAPPGEWTLPEDARVVVSLFEPGVRPKAAWGQGASFGDALHQALRSLARDYGAAFGGTFAERVVIQVDRLSPPRPLGLPRAATFEVPAFRAGDHGLLLQGRDRVAMLMPYEVSLQGLAQIGRVDGRAVLTKLLEGLGPSGADPDQPVLAFSTMGFAERVPGESIEVARLAPQLGPVTPEKVEAALVRLASHLAKMQRPDGRFVFALDPRDGRVLPSESTARHASVVRAAGELVATLGPDHPLRVAVTRGVDHLLRGLERRGLPQGKVVLAPPAEGPGGPSLAAVAVTIQALLAAPEDLQHGPAQARAVAQLGRTLQFLQRPDGSWYPDLGAASRAEPSLSKLSQSPGAALVALCDLAERDPDGPWRDLAARSARRERQDYARGGTIDAWVVQGLGRHALVASDRASGEVAYEMSRTMARVQASGAPFLSLDFGGFSGDGSLVTVAHSASYGEALREARKVAWRFGFDPRPLDAALIRLGGYLAGQQVRSGGHYAWQRPDLADGGFPAAPADPRQRLDLDAHAGRALLGAWEALRQHHPVPQLAEAVAVATSAG